MVQAEILFFFSEFTEIKFNKKIYQKTILNYFYKFLLILDQPNVIYFTLHLGHSLTNHLVESSARLNKNHAEIFDSTSHMNAKKGLSKKALNVMIFLQKITSSWANCMGNE